MIYELKVTVKDIRALLEGAKNKEELARCIQEYADAPEEKEVVVKVDGGGVVSVVNG